MHACMQMSVILVGVLGAFLVSGLQIMNLQIGLGIVFPIFGGFCYASYLWLKRQATSKTEYNPYQILFYTFLFALPSIMVVWIIFYNVNLGPAIVGFSVPSTLQLGLLLFATFSSVLPY